MMFVPVEDISSQKKFKKPNILRKKVKTLLPKSNILEPSESMDTEKDFCVSSVENDRGKVQSEIDPFGDDHLMAINALNNNAIVNNEVSDEKHKTNHFTHKENEMDTKSEENSNQALVNIEAFFNESQGENMMLYDIDFKPGKQIETLVVIEDESPRNGMYIEKNSDLITSTVPLSAVTSQYGGQNEAIVQTPNIYALPTTLPKYKCDAPNCKKEFRSEQNLKKHRNIHNEDGSIKPSRQVTVECPVKKIEADGTKAACGRIFLVRELLLKHLNEDHTPDDAGYACEECGRRFFWSSGLRAHGRSHWRPSVAVLRCAWPGCDRVFRQPCRLREHARAHNGDRPYPCQYPECGWSFRSASKLLRHARRHTGERRHVCAACGRAFLRREHLREHQARHHAARPHHACSHPGCELTFNNMSTLYLHMKKVHKNKDVGAPETVTIELPSLKSNSEETFLVNLPSEVETAKSEQVTVEVDELETETEAEVEVEVESEMGGSWRAARTHCTWPLRATPAAAPAIHDQYTVEQSEETSESNIYVRSDMFLHGNVLINEDSQQSGAVVTSGDALDNDLGLLDAHPTVDLMQEELLYTEAGDESSFRIFLLSGEELT